jgi:hypothetical protein
MFHEVKGSGLFPRSGHELHTLFADELTFLHSVQKPKALKWPVRLGHERFANMKAWHFLTFYQQG